jgi:transposase
LDTPFSNLTNNIFTGLAIDCYYPSINMEVMMPKQKFKIINEHAAGIDIGSREIFIALPSGEVKTFGTFTSNFKSAVEYLKTNNIKTVAMESTGVYWVTLYDMIEQAGINVCLVKSTMIKNVPGRKTDVSDCQWIQQLHSFGLLRASFIPDDQTRKLRSYVRLRKTNIRLASDHIRRAQKALDLMNIKLHFVICQINGVSGLRIINAILNGERNPLDLVELCDRQILKTKRQKVIDSLVGNYREEHLFALKQAIDGYQFYQQKTLECDKEIEKLLNEINKDKPTPSKLKKPKPIRHNKPQIENLHLNLMKMTKGNDPSQITGLTDSTLLQLIAEVGTNMNYWKTEKHFTSWLGLAPNTHQSGTSFKKRKIRNSSNAGQIFRIAAQTLVISKHNAFGAFYRRIQSKKGKLTAMKATARKLAVCYYNVMTKGIEYVEYGIQQYEQKIKEQKIKYLKKQAYKFGFSLSPQLE